METITKQNQDDVLENSSKVDTEKYIRMAKQRIADDYKVAVKENDLKKLSQLEKEIKKLDKISVNDGFTKYMGIILDDTYKIITHKQKSYNSKTASDIKKSKSIIEDSLSKTKKYRSTISSLINKMDERIYEKNKDLITHHTILNDLNDKVSKETKDIYGLEKTIKIEKDELTKIALMNLKDESEIRLSSLKSDLLYKQQAYKNLVKNKRMYLTEKLDLDNSSQIFNFNINFYESELKELEFFADKYDRPSVVEVDLEAQINYSLVAETKLKAKEIENKKIKLYNEAIDSKSSLSETKDKYIEFHINSPKMKF